MVIKTPECSLSILHWFHVSPFYMAATLTINVIATGLIVEESFSLESHQGGYMYEIGSVCVHLWLQGSCYCHHTFSFLHWGLCFLPPEVFVFWGSHWSHWPCWKSQTGVRMTHTCLCVYVCVCGLQTRPIKSSLYYKVLGVKEKHSVSPLSCVLQFIPE